MKYRISVNEVNKEGSSVKGFASVTFGKNFKVSNIAVLKGKDGNLFVSMPRYKTR